MATEAEERIEAPAERQASTSSTETVVKEASAGKTELVDKQKEHLDFLKHGGKSGITDEFGKPILFDDDNNFEAAASKNDSLNEKFASAKEDANADKGDEASKDRRPAKPGVVEMEAMVVTAKVPYAGEGLTINITPEFKVAERGDTLASIAREKLPKDATPEQIKAYEKELAVVNGLDPKKPGNLEGKNLLIPGHTTDGGIVTLDADYRVTTRWKDGAERIQDQDGRGYARKPDGAGGYTEKHWGPRQDDQFELTHTADGKVLIADKPGDTPREVPPSSEEVKAERQKLNDLAAEKISDPEKRAKFEADMLRFEERAAKQVPPLGPQEIIKTYEQMERLLNTAGDAPLKQEDRVKLAEQVMAQLASPHSIDQGQHNTCNVTTGESMLYTKHPSDVAKLVADVAISGEYTAKDGTKVTVDPKAADAEARNNPPVDGERSHASQIYQVTAINLFYQKQPFSYTDATGATKVVPAGQIEYQQMPDQPGALPPVVGGERMLDKTTTPPTVIMRDWVNNIPLDSPSVADRAMIDAPNIITGTNDAVLIEHKKGVYGDATGVTMFESEQQMKDLIKKAKDENKLPIIIGVHTGQEPFLHDSGGGAAGGSGGWHVVTITDYDESTGKVKIDNQWGSSADHRNDGGVHVDDLYRASRHPKDREVEEAPWYTPWEEDKTVNVAVRDLQKVVDYNREHNKIDTQKELELLRLKNKYDGMSNADYDKELKKTVTDAAARWEKQKADGTFDQAEYNNAQSKLKDLVHALPPSRRINVVDEMHAKGMMDDKQFGQELRAATASFFDDTHTDAAAVDYMQRLKPMADRLPADQRTTLYEQVNDTATTTSRLELLQLEKQNGVITDAYYDEQVAKTTIDYLAEGHSAPEIAAYTTRFWTMMGALPEDRRRAILAKVVPAPASP